MRLIFKDDLHDRFGTWPLAYSRRLIRFTADDGADDHCEMGNRSLLNRRVLDWLDEVLSAQSMIVFG